MSTEINQIIMNKLNKESKVYIVRHNETLVIHYDDNINYYRDRKDVCVFNTSGDLHTLMALTAKLSEVPRRGIETIIIDSLLVNYKLKYCYNLFAGFRNLKRIIGLEYLNTSEVVNMAKMFILCSSLVSLDLRGFDTSKVTDMSLMFNGCYALSNLDISNFNTSNVTNMSCMFSYCEKLTSLNLSSFNTSKVMHMNEMFDECKNLKTIYVGTGFNTNNLRESKNMFNDCPNLVGEKGTKYNPIVVDRAFIKIDGGKDNPGYFTHSYKELWIN